MPTAPETLARQALINVLATKFAPVEVRSDRLHASLGDEFPVIGVYPERTAPEPRNSYQNEFQLAVQYFNQYEKKVDRQQTVDPAVIEDLAEKFRATLKAADPKTGAVGYFELSRIEYPPDPTGNMTRFVAYVTAYGNNSALV